MFKRLLLSGTAILISWMAVDLVLHRLFLAPIYTQNPCMWRPFDQLNLTLVYAVTLLLIGVFEAAWVLLVKPKSLGAGLTFGALMGMALGASAGFGTYIHSPIPLELAWGWSAGGMVKAVAAGALLGWMLPNSSPRSTV